MKILNYSPAVEARKLHERIGWTRPSDFTLEEIANSLQINVRQVPMKGSEGRILIKGDTAIISLSDTINHEGKRNFVLGHEIAHFILHKHLMTLFSDTQKTLSDWHTKGPHEQEANAFAAELLLPEQLFREKVSGKKLNISLIEDTSAYFGASLTATFLRYVSLGRFPLMVVFMEDGIIKWKKESEDFPFKYLQYGSVVPAWTVAGDYFSRGRLETKPEKINAMEWFAEDSQIEYKKDWKLWEQCYQVSANGLVSCLWTF